MGLMALVNLVAITPLAVIAFRLLKDYNEQRRQGIDPVFTRDRMPDLRGVECWEPREEAEPKEKGRSPPDRGPPRKREEVDRCRVWGASGPGAPRAAVRVPRRLRQHLVHPKKHTNP